MFKRLQQKWKVGPVQIILIIICFAVGGSLTGFAAKKIMNLVSIEQDWIWAIVYILLVTLVWPVAVIIVGVLFGQHKFFMGYVRRLGQEFGLVPRSRIEEVPPRSYKGSRAKQTTTRVAIFASGAGSNAQKIIDHFRNSRLGQIDLIVCNNKKAGVLQIAEKENIPALIIDRENFSRSPGLLEGLISRKIDFIVLAGFLWKIPAPLIETYPKRIVNIHPALLPKYGGKGMYGNNVHEAVIAARERESGITIHYVDEHYDNGDVILQVRCPVLDDDSLESLAHRIHALEHANYPVIIEELITRLHGVVENG